MLRKKRQVLRTRRPTGLDCETLTVERIAVKLKRTGAEAGWVAKVLKEPVVPQAENAKGSRG